MASIDKNRDLYQEVVEQLLARVLAMQNRNPLSQTYGCFDRNFWHFKTIIDFPSATYQQPVLGLSQLLTSKAKANPYVTNPILKEVVRAGILFWCSIQNKDGSVNEYYQNDHSFCPTAYTTYAVAQAYYLTQKLFSPLERQQIINHLQAGGLWLSRHTNPLVYNQMIASMNALFWTARLTGNQTLKRAFEKRRQDILSAQTEEGWFPENNGADIGYSFQDLDLFSAYLSEVDDKPITASVIKLLKFCRLFLHPDGSTGGEYGSRCTQHVFPFGLEFLTDRNIPEACDILRWFRYWFERRLTIIPEIVDDKYTNYFYFNSYIQAFLTPKVNHLTPKRTQKNLSLSLTYLKKAGIITLNLGSVSAWIGVKRNGSLRVFSQEKLLYQDIGYLVKLSDHRLCATQAFNDIATATYHFSKTDCQITIEGFAGLIDDSLPLTRWLIPFKLFCKTVLNLNPFADWFAHWLKYRKVVKRYPLPLKLTRQLLITRKGFQLHDVLTVTNSPLTIQAVHPIQNVTTTHSLSSRYYHPQYLTAPSLPQLLTATPTRFEFKYKTKGSSAGLSHHSPHENSPSASFGRKTK
ncbi:hypothetical protein A3A66_00820 [Microgenomates group bacterium RIFCSPLOWO2_01_FULL_46_13]|nr:MAG: hypothetical protein A3A66_00820 [Microgenomates group bacterium RIFCSPLOWO2_01_FULL_46_13]